jgi:hypothetical protein
MKGQFQKHTGKGQQEEQEGNTRKPCGIDTIETRRGSEEYSNRGQTHNVIKQQVHKNQGEIKLEHRRGTNHNHAAGAT